MRTPFLLVLFTAVLTVCADAGEFKLPPGKPVATIDIDNAWRPEAITRGVQAQTEDGTVYLSIEGTTDAGEMGKIIDESDAMLKTRKVALSRGTRQDNKLKLNDLPAEELVYTGRDEDGPVKVSFTFVVIRDAAVVITYWASNDGDRKHHAEVDKILASLKPVAPAAGPAKGTP